MHNDSPQVKLVGPEEKNLWTQVVTAVIQSSGMKVMEMSESKRGILIHEATLIADSITKHFQMRH